MGASGRQRYTRRNGGIKLRNEPVRFYHVQFEHFAGPSFSMYSTGYVREETRNIRIKDKDKRFEVRLYNDFP